MISGKVNLLLTSTEGLTASVVSSEFALACTEDDGADSGVDVYGCMWVVHELSGFVRAVPNVDPTACPRARGAPVPEVPQDIMDEAHEEALRASCVPAARELAVEEVPDPETLSR